ncbi:hypothetical protein CRX72_20515 [Pantoea sp. BRM17]|nr:hypothetical protein CRX72_20515 [Pantoea sp. BRM17]
MRANNLSESELRIKCRSELRKMSARIEAGETIPEPRRQLLKAAMPSTPEKAREGVALLRATLNSGSPFLPSPGQFISWCKQDAFAAAGLPDEETLYSRVMTYCAQRGDYASPEHYPWKSNADYWMVTSRRLHQAIEKVIDEFFSGLKQVFPASVSTVWRDPADEAAAKRQWIAALAENGVTSKQQLSAGMRQARAVGHTENSDEPARP